MFDLFTHHETMATATALRVTQPQLQALPVRSLFVAQPTDFLICDPCYLLPDAAWHGFVGQMFQGRVHTDLADAGLVVLPTGGLVLYGTTQVGDGCYFPQRCDMPVQGDCAGVDAGMLCFVSVADAALYAGPDSLALRPDLSLRVRGLQGTIHTDGHGHFWCPEIGLVLNCWEEG